MLVILGVQTLPEEDKYVLRHEWIKKNGDIYERINTDYKHHTEALNTLKTKFEIQTVLQEQTISEQKETNENIKELTKVMTEFGNDVTEIKYTVKDHDGKINSIQGTIDTKQKGSIQILAALISAVGGIIAAAFGFAQYFF